MNAGTSDTPAAHWLDALRAVLDAAPKPLPVFFRDDDAGWDDARLFALLDVFEARQAPIDLAVIPTALSDALAEALRERHDRSDGLLGLHQHGHAHTNHEASGRKCEFGPSRDRLDEAHDLREGQARLRAAFGARLDAVFTPPWNRCTAQTAQLLAELGIEVLSRNVGAAPLDAAGLAEVPVAVDWCKAIDGRRASAAEHGQRLADAARAALQAGEPLGVMLHHEVMDAADLALVDELLVSLTGHRRVQCVRLPALADRAKAALQSTERSNLTFTS